ncbi:U-box domain-containing protein 21-like [Humulus lupulus]|uniref:U-box domain-containing protein 21-like n=1 Tax=Humulus lupulus TaxID=3486 RepID=UPI002B40F766|nr:U-box domain-containing protein 21-like [Humulus lupulus]
MVLGWRLRRKSTKKSPMAMKVEIPNHFLCPISFDLMKDPVTLSSGITYDRESIEKWLEDGNFTCPVTNQILQSFDQIPNHSLRKMIQEWGMENQKHGFHRIPTPRIPVVPTEVSETLLAIEASSRQLDLVSCRESLKKIEQWGAEGERNRRCMITNDAADTLSAAFESFAGESFEQNGIVCEQILSNLVWMFPIGKVARQHLGSEASLRCMVRFLTHTDISTKQNSITTLEEVLSHDENQYHVELLTNIDGVSEILFELIRKKVSTKITKAALVIIFHMVSVPAFEDIRSSFLEMGLVSSLLEILVESTEEKIISERALSVMDGVLGFYEGRVKAYQNALTVPVLVKKLLRVSVSATEFSVSAIWKLCMNAVVEQEKEELGKVVLVEALRVGGFQKLLLIIQVGCGVETKEKATEVLKLLNPYRPELECIETVDFKSLQRSF